MLRRVLAWVATVLIGIALGLASAWGALDMGRASFSETYGGWQFNRAAGSQAAGPYTRAIIAITGLLALSSREAVYFNRDRDENGHPLDEACIYELSGHQPDARWWSVTLYAPDNYLAQNNDHAASIDASRIDTSGDGLWSARVSQVRGEALNWLSSRGARRGFSLTLRLYNTGRDFRPSADNLPTLRTVSCPGGGA